MAKNKGSSAGSSVSPSQRERSNTGESPMLEGGGGSMRLATIALRALITRCAASRKGRDRIEACDQTTRPAPLERSAASLDGAPPIENPAASNISASALACGSSSRTHTMRTSATAVSVRPTQALLMRLSGHSMEHFGTIPLNAVRRDENASNYGAERAGFRVEQLQPAIGDAIARANQLQPALGNRLLDERKRSQVFQSDTNRFVFQL